MKRRARPKPSRSPAGGAKRKAFSSSTFPAFAGPLFSGWPSVSDRRHPVRAPIRITFLPIDARGGVTGRIAGSIAPGKRGIGLSGIVHDRDLDSDVRRLRDDLGVDIFVTLVEPRELVAWCIPDLLVKAQQRGMIVRHYPIPDRGAPPTPDAPAPLIAEIVSALREGKTTIVSCVGGLGRTGTILAATLMSIGYEREEAMRMVRAARPGAIETQTQEAWLITWEAWLASPAGARFSAQVAQPTEDGRSPGGTGGRP